MSSDRPAGLGTAPGAAPAGAAACGASKRVRHGVTAGVGCWAVPARSALHLSWQASSLAPQHSTASKRVPCGCWCGVWGVGRGRGNLGQAGKPALVVLLVQVAALYIYDDFIIYGIADSLIHDFQT